MPNRLIRSLLRGCAPALLGFGLLAPPTGSTGTPAGWPAGTAGPTPLASAVTRTASTMAAAGQPYAQWAATRTFVAFDPRGDGRAVEVVGDLGTAERIVILVPGVGVRLFNFDRGVGGVRQRALSNQAWAVQAEAHALDPAAKLAVVAWLGYDPPDGLALDAARADAAERGAADLAAFVAELAATRPGVGITVIGHSYGAVVIGRAAPRMTAVTDLIALGAPGMGVDRLSDLHTGARVWAAQADQDWIRWVPGGRLLGLGHGPHPADPSFGAHPLPAAGVQGHDGYLRPGSPTLHAVARIALGHGTELTR